MRGTRAANSESIVLWLACVPDTPGRADLEFARGKLLMRAFALALAFTSLITSAAVAAPGDQWILPIHHTEGPLTTYAGVGYQGSTAYGRVGFDGVARVYWEFSGNAIGSGNPAPATAELYSFEFYDQHAGHNNWLPVEVDFNGSGPGNGEGQQDSSIPWGGQFGTNHQWIGSNGSEVGQWHTMGPGPQAPASYDYNVLGNGLYMYMKAGSWPYVKWNYSFQNNNMDRTWSALRVTQLARPPIELPDGDYNGNGTVDAADFVLWATGDPAADGVEDSIIDEYDWYYWKERFGDTNENDASGGSATLSAVPEPATILLFVLPGAASVVARPRRRRATS
jgi:hypothetical protein